MKVPVQIVFEGMAASESLDAAVRTHVTQLEHFFDRATSCRVVIKAPHRRRKGGLYSVAINLEVPHASIVLNRQPSAHHEHEDAHIALRDAFNAARRKLEDYARCVRHDVKSHSSTRGAK